MVSLVMAGRILKRLSHANVCSHDSVHLWYVFTNY